jgi:hypothetical protein
MKIRVSIMTFEGFSDEQVERYDELVNMQKDTELNITEAAELDSLIPGVEEVDYEAEHYTDLEVEVTVKSRIKGMSIKEDSSK